MIKESEANGLRGRAEIPRRLDVRVARRRIARRMVVGDGEGAPVVAEDAVENLANRHQ